MVAVSTLLFGLLFLVCAVVIGASLRKVLAMSKPLERSVASEGGQELVARKVRDPEGKDVGETVRVEGEEVVLKHEGTFLVVPKAALREDGERLRAEGVDWAEAKAKGEAWRTRQEDVMRSDAQGMPILER